MDGHSQLTNNALDRQSVDLFQEKLRHTFFPGKFSAPRVDAALHILRAKAMRALVAPARRNPKTICIEARAGQGKSTLAAQFLRHIQAQFTWCQVGPEDRDPIVFMSALFAALLKARPGLAQSSLHTMIARETLVAEEAQRLAELLAADLRPLLRDELYLVLDDLHYIDRADTSLAFLNTLVAKAPQGLRFLLISRTAIGVAAKDALRLGNDHLTMTHTDVAELFVLVFKVPLPFEAVAQLQRLSEGWVMGLVLAGNAVAEQVQHNPANPLATPLTIEPDQFWTYFQDEILNLLDPSGRRALLKLSLLDNIPIGLARRIAPAPEPETFLPTLVQKNFFLRRLEETPPCYCFHHLFQEYLRQRAEAELNVQERRIVLAKAGHWFLRHSHLERALQYYLKAQTYGMAEKILRDIGPQLLATNRAAPFKQSMAGIAPEAIQRYAWLSFFIANVYMRSDPNRCLAYLEQARQRFLANGQELGELMATATLIAFHAGIDCRFKHGQTLLPRAEALYQTMADQLSAAARIQCGYAIAYGLCYFTGQMRRAAQYTDECLSLAQTHGLEDAMASSAVARGLIRGLEGDWATFRQEIEHTRYLLQSPQVGAMAKLAMRLQELSMLGVEADFETFRHYRGRLAQRVDRHLLAKTIFGPLMLDSDIDQALAQGHLEQALAAANQGAASDGSGHSAHIQSQFHAILAYLYALSGQRDQALTAAQASVRLRQAAGGAYHDAVNHMAIGAVYSQLQQYKRAESLLTQAITGARHLGARYILLSAHAHRAYARLEQDKLQPALEDLAICLKTMKRAPYERFLLFNPIVARRLLTAAVQHGIAPDHARHIAQRQLRVMIDPQAELFPLLWIKTLGGLELRIQSEARICQADLTATQRELLSLLVSAPQAGLSHEIIQDAFWPESPPDKVRSKLDNLLARLRKVFNTRLSPYPAGLYLAMERGFVRLQNCLIDAQQFECDVQRGLSHLRKGEKRQAELALFKAQHLYEGPFMPGVHLSDLATEYQSRLQRAFREAAGGRAQLLAEAGHLVEAIATCQRALQYDPSHPPLVKILYQLHTRNNDPVLARQVLADYRKALAQDGFSTQEIEQILEDFWRGD